MFKKKHQGILDLWISGKMGEDDFEAHFRE